MKIIRNNIIPFPGYKAINLFGILFVRKNARIDQITLNHESIHTAQMKELLYIFFYIWYIIEWLLKVIGYSIYWLYKKIKRDIFKFDFQWAYRNLLFEKEAYNNESNLNYLKSRKHYSWLWKQTE